MYTTHNLSFILTIPSQTRDILLKNTDPTGMHLFDTEMITENTFPTLSLSLNSLSYLWLFNKQKLYIIMGIC